MRYPIFWLFTNPKLISRTLLWGARFRYLIYVSVVLKRSLLIPTRCRIPTLFAGADSALIRSNISASVIETRLGIVRANVGAGGISPSGRKPTLWRSQFDFN